MMKKHSLFLFLTTFAWFWGISCTLEEAFSVEPEILSYSKVQTAQPLKGFATWEGDSENGVPCSLEYIPIPFNKVLVAENKCDFSFLEKKLEDAKKRRHQAIVRFIIDDTGTGLYLPEFLSSVKKFEYTDESYTGYSPDYNDEKLLGQIEFFIKELAKKYDGDVRIANIETGIIGHWGEQHTYYCEKIAEKEKAKVSDATWKRFFKAFSDSFSETCISVRSPSHPGVSSHPKLGYYNDMVYSDSDDEYFMEMLNTEKSLWDHWKDSMITGEFAPGLQSDFISKCGKSSDFSKYKKRIEEFHVSSLLCGEAFESNQKKELILAASNALGYDFTVLSSSCSYSGSELKISLSIKNVGIAPFYYKWPVKIAVFKNGKIIESFKTDWDIRTIFPDNTKTFEFSKTVSSAEGCTVLLGIPNPMGSGYPVSFSNDAQDKDLKGWLSLGSLKDSL